MGSKQQGKSKSKKGKKKKSSVFWPTFLSSIIVILITGIIYFTGYSSHKQYLGFFGVNVNTHNMGVHYHFSGTVYVIASLGEYLSSFNDFYISALRSFYQGLTFSWILWFLFSGFLLLRIALYPKSIERFVSCLWKKFVFRLNNKKASGVLSKSKDWFFEFITVIVRFLITVIGSICAFLILVIGLHTLVFTIPAAVLVTFAILILGLIIFPVWGEWYGEKRAINYEGRIKDITCPVTANMAPKPCVYIYSKTGKIEKGTELLSGRLIMMSEKKISVLTADNVIINFPIGSEKTIFGNKELTNDKEIQKTSKDKVRGI